MLELRKIQIDTAEYEQMIDLRHRILRVPIGLRFTKEDRKKDESDILLGAFLPDGNRLVGCCILSEKENRIVQLRQMAVDDPYQRKGFGEQLVGYAEQVAEDELQSDVIVLHARQSAMDFYKRLGYDIDGDVFIEVGIPHVEMKKIMEK